MVIATNLGSLFDLLQCNIPQKRAKCCLEFTVVSGYQIFLAFQGELFPPLLCRLCAACRGHTQFPGTKRSLKGSMADRPGLEPAFCGVSARCISGMLYRRHR